MKFNYWQVISHIVPGFVLSINIIVFLSISGIIEQTTFANIQGFYVTSFIFISLMFGIIIDSFHHRFIAEIYKRLICKNENEKVQYSECKKEMKYIKEIGIDILDRVYNSFYVFSEAYVNIATSLLPVPFLIIIGKYGNYCSKVILVSTITIIILFLYWSGYKSRKYHYAALSEIISKIENI